MEKDKGFFVTRIPIPDTRYPLPVTRRPVTRFFQLPVTGYQLLVF